MRVDLALLQMEGDGAIRVGSDLGDQYLDGALYVDGHAHDDQMAFRLVFDPWSAWLGRFGEAFGWAGVFVLACLLNFLPGWALLHPTWKGSPVCLGLSGSALPSGVSLTMFPILILSGDLMDLRIGPLYAWIPVAGSAIVLIPHIRSLRAPRMTKAVVDLVRSPAFWADVALLVAMALALPVRPFAPHQ